jgi:hypothetical protein
VIPNTSTLDEVQLLAVCFQVESFVSLVPVPVATFLPDLTSTMNVTSVTISGYTVVAASSLHISQANFTAPAMLPPGLSLSNRAELIALSSAGNATMSGLEIDAGAVSITEVFAVLPSRVRACLNDFRLERCPRLK